MLNNRKEYRAFISYFLN
ncbi:hypothetical protein FOXB_05168 [Fusarium oxysporum f. sp. conglutinans Fo5176]|uniref:Uncharacterized protein n=1 Tax=Fusarium oxysporum (strain Fo5176) TaxID=660025 RepID=F9FFI9_FUSOF|nr:hypothetical protein FOXB_05168 [Fusarium oxysporum f. sp. conglutinans Fo5176]